MAIFSSSPAPLRRLASLWSIPIAMLLGGTAVAQPITTCDSKILLERFGEFGRTGKMPPDLGAFLNDPVLQKVEPYKAFDNVAYVGICWVSAWLITSPQGHVLIDTLYGPFTDQLMANIRKVGADPADIRMVFVTHGHFDHAGGMHRLKAALPNARFVMTEPGWREAILSAKLTEGRPNAWQMIERDIVAKDGEVFTVGDIKLRTVETPGHTFGTASYAFDVRDSGKTYHAFTVGGLGLNAIEGPEQVEAFIASIKRIRAMVKDPNDPITVHLTTHPFSNGLTETSIRLKTRPAGEVNPLVDPDAFLLQLDELQKGAEERLALERAKKR